MSSQDIRHEVESILRLRPDRRSILRVMSDRIRQNGHSGWRSVGDFGAICRQLGFFVYQARSRHGVQYFVSLDDKPEDPPDVFIRGGFVIRFDDSQFVNRSNPPGLTLMRASAKVWQTRTGVHRYCMRHGYLEDMIVHTKDL